MRKVILMITIFVFASSIVNAAIVSNSIIVDDIEYYIQANNSVYSLGEDVEMLFRLTNLKSEEWIVSSFFPVWDILISEKEGEIYNEIWNWSWDKIHPLGPVFLTLQPDEFMELNGTWSQIDLNGSVEIEDHTQVPPGIFRVSGYLTPTDTSISVDVNVIPEPATVLLLGLGMCLLRK